MIYTLCLKNDTDIGCYDLFSQQQFPQFYQNWLVYIASDISVIFGTQYRCYSLISIVAAVFQMNLCN